MAEYDGEVVINARIETDNVDKDLNQVSDKVTASLVRQRQVLSNLQRQYDDFVSGLMKTPEQLGIERAIKREETELKKTMKELEEIKPDYDTLKVNYDKLIPQGKENFKKLEEDVNKFNERISESNKYLDTLNQRLSKVKLNPEATISVIKLKENIDRLNQQNLDIGSSIAKSQSGFMSKFKNGLGGSLSALTGGLGKSLKGVSSGLGKTLNIMGKGLSKGFSLITSPIRLGISLLQSFGRQIFSIAKTAFILHGLRTGFRSISETISNVIASDKDFTTSLSQIKSNLLTAFYPIYQFVLPGLKMLIAALSTASSYLSQFMSHLFGQNYKSMQAGAKSFLDTANSADKSSKSLAKNKKGFSELGKDIKKARGELASFDKLNVLMQKDSSNKKSKGKESSFEFMPTTNFDERYDELLKGFDAFREKWQARLQPTIDAFRDLGETVKTKLGEFAAQAIQDFNNDFVDPLLEDFFTAGLPRFIKRTDDMIKNINWDRLNTSLNNLWEALKPFAETIGEGLSNFYDHVLAPLIEWSLSNLIPAALDAISGAFEVLNPVAKLAGKLLGAVWDNFLEPALSWVGDRIIDGLEGLSKVLHNIGDWLDKNWENIWDNFENSAKNAINFVKGIFRGFKEWIWDNIGSPIANLFGGIFRSPSQPVYGPQKPPGFAQGAVLEGGNPMLAYLNDQPRGQINIETPLNTMLDAFTTALDQRQGVSNNVVIQADGDINSIVSLLNFKIQERNSIVGNNYIKDGIFA